MALLQEWLGYWHAAVTPDVVRRARAVCEATPGWRPLGDPSELQVLYDDLLAALDAGPWDRTRQAFADYGGRLRQHHDQLCWELWALPSALGDERRALEINARTLEQCAGYNGLWQVAAALPPEGLAQLAADHLRQHLSQVTVVEEPDRIRLVLDACGSGGRMRRSGPGSAPGYARVQQPSEHTWGRAGEVPVYCTHCALNEQNSLKRLGRLAWVTEFTPDPDRPCGWTFFKSGNAPAEYHERLNGNKPLT